MRPRCDAPCGVPRGAACRRDAPAEIIRATLNHGKPKTTVSFKKWGTGKPAGFSCALRAKNCIGVLICVGI